MLGSSPSNTAKETYVQFIQELLPGVKFSDSLRKLLKSNKHFYDRLKECSGWTKNDAKAFVDEAKLFIKTSTKYQVSQTDGYSFGEVVSYMGHGNPKMSSTSSTLFIKRIPPF